MIPDTELTPPPTPPEDVLEALAALAIRPPYKEPNVQAAFRAAAA